jgi:hypothetical protein
MDELQTKFVGKYIGPDKITGVDIYDFVTPSGSLVFEVTFENEKSMIFPEKGLVAVVSDEPKNFNHVRDARVNLMVPEIMKVIEEYDIPHEQFVHLMSQVAMQWQNNFNRANALLWFGNESEYVPGSDTTDRLTLLMAKRVNQENAGG